MAQVLLLSAIAPDDPNQEHRLPLHALLAAAQRDRFRVHSLTSDAEAAAVILFAESYGAGWYFERVRRHPLTKAYRNKCFIYSFNPLVIPFLPGVYTGIAQRWASSRTAPGFYVDLKNDLTKFTPATDSLPYLYSFVGSIATATVRRNLARLSHPRGYFRDTSGDYDRLLNQRMTADERREYHRTYAEIGAASKFVLCPGGMSPSTIRLFETMRMGRVPVILSDKWVEPRGPWWDKFSIRIREADWASIPRLLERREHVAHEMGEMARAEWLTWFSEEVAFHRIVESCLAIREQRRVPESLARWPVYLQMLRPFHFRRAMGDKYRALRSRLRR